MKATAEDWCWLAELLGSQNNPDENARLLRLAAGCLERAEELETVRPPVSFIELDNNLWILGYGSKPFAAPENALHGFWILAFTLQRPGEDIDVTPFSTPGSGSAVETLAAHISRARQIITEHRPELEPHLRAVKFNRERLTARYTPPPSVAPIRFG